VRIRGAKELKARFRALRQVFKPLGRDWADRTVIAAKGRVRSKSGKTKASIRRKNASMKVASVRAWYGARFLDQGTKAHDMKPRRFAAMSFKHSKTGQPVFTKRVRHPGGRAYPFLRVSAREQLRSSDKVAVVIKTWNGAAPGGGSAGLFAGKGRGEDLGGL
jgi:hypothetical protein